MSTTKQVEANRRNAALSTGPSTPAGRAQSSMNAVKHGLTARAFFLYPEEAAQFTEFRNAYFADLRPQGVNEETTVDRIVRNFWRLRRLSEIEGTASREMMDRERVRFDKTAFDKLPSPKAPFQYERLVEVWERCARYDARIARQVHLDLHNLERWQARRSGKSVIAPIAIDRTTDAEVPAETDAMATSGKS